jgi:hypothetical protein
LERKKARSQSQLGEGDTSLTHRQAQLGEDISATHRHETRETAIGHPPKRRSATESRRFLQGDCEGGRRQGEILRPGDKRSCKTSHQPNALFPSSGEEGWSDLIALGLIGWRRRVQEREEGKASRQAKKSSLEPRSLRPALAEAGLEYSYLAQEEERDPPTVSSPSAVHDDPPRMFSDQCYASSCKRLIQFLGGRARDWAKHEFFYCDIDRAWYEPRGAMVDFFLVWVSCRCIAKRFPLFISGTISTSLLRMLQGLFLQQLSSHDENGVLYDAKYAVGRADSRKDSSPLS